MATLEIQKLLSEKVSSPKLRNSELANGRLALVASERGTRVKARAAAEAAPEAEEDGS